MFSIVKGLFLTVFILFILLHFSHDKRFNTIKFFLFLTWDAFYFLIFANFYRYSSLSSSAFSCSKSLHILSALLATPSSFQFLFCYTTGSHPISNLLKLGCRFSLFLWLWNPKVPETQSLGQAWLGHWETIGLFIRPHKVTINIFHHRNVNVWLWDAAWTLLWRWIISGICTT